VTAHDKPGFGLTHRPRDIAPFYSSEFNGRQGREVLERQLKLVSLQRPVQGGRDRVLNGGGGEDEEGGEGENGSSAAAAPSRSSTSSSPSAAAAAAAPGAPATSSSAPRAPGTVLVGHSLGSLSAALEVLRRPQGVTHVVLVAPAIFARRFQPHSPTWLRALAAPALGLSTYLAGALLALASPLLLACLRAIVRSKAFWARGLRASWHDPSGLEDTLIDGYRRPSVVREWDTGMVRFLRGRISGAARGPLEAIKRAKEELESPLITRFAATCRRRGICVLLVHGRQDLLVPLRNSRALMEDLKGVARLVEVDRCGHVPHEEYPQRFADEIRRFIAGEEPAAAAAQQGKGQE
jgi:pimeloyl-ACP methyl ester carboxylesterase